MAMKVPDEWVVTVNGMTGEEKGWRSWDLRDGRATSGHLLGETFRDYGVGCVGLTAATGLPVSFDTFLISAQRLLFTAHTG